MVLPAETVPVTIAHARQSVVAAFKDGHLSLLDDRGLLAVCEQAFRLVAQTQALAAQLLAEVDGRDAAERICKLTTAHWLHQATLTATLRVCRGQTRHAVRAFADYPDVAAAQAHGTISHDQARAIVTGLHQLSPDLDSTKRAAAMAELLNRAATFDPAELTTVAERLLHHLDPDRADELDAKRLEDQRRRAERGRHLVLYPDGHGSWIIKGKLPDVIGEQVATVLNAVTDQRCTAAREAAKNGAGDVVDGLADPHQVRADVLADIITAYTATGAAPTHGGDRPRITLTINWADLLAALGHASTEHGQTLDPSVVRRMACDADLLPAILNNNGIPLDIGRARRTIPAGLRAGVWRRDGGCAFPSCDRPPRECECHHIIPWLIGGITALPNLVLLCPHLMPGSNRPPTPTPAKSSKTPTGGKSASTTKAYPNSCPHAPTTTSAPHACTPATPSPPTTAEQAGPADQSPAGVAAKGARNGEPAPQRDDRWQAIHASANPYERWVGVGAACIRT